MTRHVFIDNSNLFGGAQRAAAAIEPEALYLAVRVHYANLFRLLHADDHVESKVLAGSIPPATDALWNHARNAGYNTDLLRRIEHDDGRIAEQGVDELVHLKIANALLDFDPPQTLVLVTGDGHDSEFGTSFREQVERALRRGWQVQLWSWREQLSRRFRTLVERGGGQMTIHELDLYYRSLTFIQGGTYDVNGSTVSISGRNARSLPPS